MAAFNSDSDSDDEPAKKRSPIGLGVSQKRQARLIQEGALKEDPTIFQYDELYDDMNQEREEAKKVAKASQSKKVKYVEKLLLTADKRKKEYERRIERQVQKERDAEGDKYKDKESFVTASYRAKLEQMRIEEEAEKRQDYLENIGDVTKQRDLGGFYRHLYEQKMGPEKKEDAAGSQTETEQANQPKVSEEPKSLGKSSGKKSQARTYRKRISHENEDGSDKESDAKKEDIESNEKKTHLQSNIDADSDFSIDDSDSEDEKVADRTKDKEDKTAGGNETDEKKEEKKGDIKIEKKETKDEFVRPEPVADIVKKEPSVEKEPPKPKIDIWKKRTVGDVFDAALQRYYERKQLKCQ